MTNFIVKKICEQASEQRMKKLFEILENSANFDRITVAAIQYLVEQISSQLNFHKHVTPHTLRHTAATLMLENNVSIKKVQRHLRHSSIQTTARYLHILDNKEAASEAILGGI